MFDKFLFQIDQYLQILKLNVFFFSLFIWSLSERKIVFWSWSNCWWMLSLLGDSLLIREMDRKRGSVLHWVETWNLQRSIIVRKYCNMATLFSIKTKGLVVPLSLFANVVPITWYSVDVRVLLTQFTPKSHPHYSFCSFSSLTIPKNFWKLFLKITKKILMFFYQKDTHFLFNWPFKLIELIKISENYSK